jgi:hypothetical protein
LVDETHRISLAGTGDLKNAGRDKVADQRLRVTQLGCITYGFICCRQASKVLGVLCVGIRL